MELPFFRKRSARAAPPWAGRQSIFEFLSQTHPAVGSAAELPDEEPEAGQTRWAAGALDGVMGHHAAKTENPDLAVRVGKAVLLWQRKPDDDRLQAIYDLAENGAMLALADPLSEHLPSVSGLEAGQVRRLANWLCTTSTHRGPVKLGIILLGLTGKPDDRPVLHTLGRHDEFTLFCAVALGRISDDWLLDLWELAKHADGWGKVHVVERLCTQDDPRLKEWFIRDGFRNSVMNEYLACPCAKAGRLHEAMQQEAVDDALLDSTAELLDALVNGGPAEDIDDYPEAAPAIIGYLAHVAKRRQPALRHFLTAMNIAEWLQADGDAWSSRYQRGWSPAAAQECRERCAALNALPHWTGHALAEAGSDDRQRYWQATKTLEGLGHPTWDIHWRHLLASPSDGSRWFEIMRLCDDSHIDPVVAYAEKALPLAEMAKGPDPAQPSPLMGTGWDMCLDYIVQELRRFPGKGWALVRTALASPIIRCRNMGMMALSIWGREHWPDDAEAALRAAMLREPDERLRLNLGRLLSGQQIK